MKHLNRFNENKSNTIDLKYIEDCFIEFKDKGIFDLEHNKDMDEIYIDIKFDRLSEYKNIYLNPVLSVEDIINLTKIKLDLLEDVTVSIKKVSIEYKSIQYRIEHSNKNIKIRMALDTSSVVIRYPREWNGENYGNKI